MVKCIGKFSLLLKRLRDAWMDMLPMSAMSEERRRNQYLADVTQESEERQRRNMDTLDPERTGNQRQVECHTGDHPRKVIFIQ